MTSSLTTTTLTSWTQRTSVLHPRSARIKESSMNDNLKKGDKVSWETGQGKTTGKVIRKQTSDTHIKGHKVKAFKEDPQMIVESEKSGKQAAHKPGSLKKA